MMKMRQPDFIFYLENSISAGKTTCIRRTNRREFHWRNWQSNHRRGKPAFKTIIRRPMVVIDAQEKRPLKRNKTGNYGAPIIAQLAQLTRSHCQFCQIVRRYIRAYTDDIPFISGETSVAAINKTDHINGADQHGRSMQKVADQCRN